MKQESLYIIRGPMVSPELTDWPTMPTAGDVVPVYIVYATSKKHLSLDTCIRIT